MHCRELEWAAVYSPLQALLGEFVLDSSREQDERGGAGGEAAAAAEDSAVPPGPSSSSSSSPSLSSPSFEHVPRSLSGQDGGGGCRVSCAIYELMLSANTFWKVRGS